MAYRQSGGSSRQQEAGYRYNAPKDDDKVKPEQLGRKAVKKDEQQNAPRSAPKRKKPSGGGGPQKLPSKNAPTPTPRPQQLPVGGLRHVGGAGSGPANFAGSPIPTPTPAPMSPQQELAVSPPRPDNFTPPTPAPAPFSPQVPPNANMSQASILNTVPPELRAAPPAPYMYPTPPSNSMAGTETAPSQAPQQTILDQQGFAGQERSPYPVPGNSMAGNDLGPMGSDPKDVLARLLMLARQGGAPGQPPQPQTGALGFPIPPNPFAGS